MFSLPLDSRRIAAALAGHDIGGEVQVHEELLSTNDTAEQLGLAGFAHGLVVLAEGQSAGRGRRENRWHAPAGRDILMSVLLRPAQRLELWPRMTTLAALAICKAVGAVRSFRPQIKWPNDVYLRDRKVAGILGETFVHHATPYMVLGIGLNVNADLFPSDLRATATSLLLESGAGAAPLDRSALVIAVLKELDGLCHHLDQGFEKVLAEVKSLSWLLGRRILAQIPGGTVRGMVEDLNPEGHLLLRDEAGEIRVLSSAQQVRRIE